MNIKDMSVVNLFDDINKKEELNELYKKIIEEEIILDKHVSRKAVGERTLSDYINSHTIKYYITGESESTDSGEKEPPKTDLPKIEIEQLPKTPEFEEPSDFNNFRDNLVKYIKGEEVNSDYPNIKKEYDSLFSSVGVIKERDFVTEIINTQSFDELKDLYNSLIDKTQRAYINSINAFLKMNNKEIKGLEGENAYTRYIRDIENNNNVIQDTRKHIFYDFKSIEDGYNEMGYCSSRVASNLNTIYDGFQSEYYDLHQYGIEVIKALDTTNLNNFYNFLKNNDVSTYIDKATKTKNIPSITDYKKLIPQIFSSLPDDIEQSDKDKEQEFLKLLDSPMTVEQGEQLMEDIIALTSKYPTK